MRTLLLVAAAAVVVVILLPTSRALEWSSFSLQNWGPPRSDQSLPLFRDDQEKRRLEAIEYFPTGYNCSSISASGLTQIECRVLGRFDGANETFVDVDINLTCTSREATTEFREADSCECSASVTDQAGLPKNCSCGVCPAGFGTGDFYFSCEDDFLLDNCTSVDCALACDGPCSGTSSCDGPDQNGTASCTLCEDFEASKPPDADAITFGLLNFNCTSNGTAQTCMENRRLTSADGSVSDVSFSVTCDAPTLTEDYRQRAENCTCSVETLHTMGQMQNHSCTCNVCPEGFGLNPVSIICKDNALVGQCSSIDCNSRCDGSCLESCAADGDVCPALCDCYDMLVQATPIDLNQTFVAYHGLSFEIMTRTESVDIVSLAIHTGMSLVNDTSVVVTINGQTVANTVATVSPDGSRLVIPPQDFTPFMMAANKTVTVLVLMDEEVVHVANVTDDTVTEGSHLVVLPGYGLLSNDPDDIDNSSSVQFSGEIRYRLGDDCKDCQPCIDDEIVLDECETLNETLTCLRDTRVTAPDGTFADLSTVRMCNVSAGNGTYPTDCACFVNVTDFLGRDIDCQCSVCATGFGTELVSVDCGENMIIGACSSLDCNLDCNGLCLSSCEDSGQDCLVCPTPSPGLTDQPTAMPTSIAPTAAPTRELITYTYTDLVVRLQGGQEFTEETRDAFENATENFYESFFGLSLDSSRRQLQINPFAFFETDISSTNEDLDTAGITISYDQTVRFRMQADRSTPTENEVRETLLFQLQDPTRKSAYLAFLHNAHPDFLTISEVNPSSIDDDSDGGLEIWLIILIALGGALCCCCCIVFCCGYFTNNMASGLFSKRRRHQDKVDLGEMEKKYETGAPEAVAYDASENQDHSAFADEPEKHKDADYHENSGNVDYSYGEDGSDEGDDDDDSQDHDDSDESENSEASSEGDLD